MKAEDKELFHKIILYTIPSAVDFALQSAANYADYIMTGRLGQTASASIGLTTEVNFLLRGLLTALGIGIVSFIAIAQGHGEKENSRKAAAQAFYLSLAAGIFLLVTAASISSVLPKWMGADKSIWELSADYFRICSFGLVGAAFNMMFGSVLKGYGDMKTPMYVNVGMNMLNICLNFFFIFDSRRISFAGHYFSVWGASLGVNGAAWATAAANTVGGLCMFLAVLRRREIIHGIKQICPDLAIIKKILLVAFPAFLCRVITSMGRILFTTFVTGLGTTAFAAHTITFTAESLFYMPVVGAQSAVTTLAGNAKGEGDKEKLHRLIRLSCLCIGGFMGLVGMIMIVSARTVLSFFSVDSEVLQIGRILFYIVAVNEPIFGISVVMEGIFNGIGDTRRTFIISAATLWIVRVAGTWVAVKIFQTGVYGAWVCMVLENMTRGIALLLSGRIKESSLVSV